MVEKKKEASKMTIQIPANAICIICGNHPDGPHTEECLKAEAELISQEQEREQAYQEAREERVALQQQERDEWREQRYFERVAEQQEQEKRARAYRYENAPPDRKWLEWMDTLALLQEVTAANYAAHGIVRGEGE